jgi:hypothetical protein
VIAHESHESQREFGEPFSFRKKQNSELTEPETHEFLPQPDLARKHKNAPPDVASQTRRLNYGAGAYSVLGRLKVSVGLLRLRFAKLLA